MQSRDKLTTSGNSKYRLRNPGRKTVYYLNGIEDVLINWITTERLKGYLVTLTDITTDT